MSRFVAEGGDILKVNNITMLLWKRYVFGISYVIGCIMETVERDRYVSMVIKGHFGVEKNKFLTKYLSLQHNNNKECHHLWTIVGIVNESEL